MAIFYYFAQKYLKGKGNFLKTDSKVFEVDKIGKLCSSI